ncbi:MAG: hypothetical protein C9356_15805 [Oleiphilus sp.]|nr:MAG: hypothetical protein C9356_15805 [Oleiphilus sp.]
MDIIQYSSAALAIYLVASIGFDYLFFAKLYDQLDYNPFVWKLVYQDLGSRYRRKNPFFSARYRNYSIRGNPDLILRNRFMPWSLVVIDYKVRNGNEPNHYEFIQVSLYVWLAQQNSIFSHVRGYIRFGNGKLAPVKHAQHITREVLALSEELHALDY